MDGRCRICSAGRQLNNKASYPRGHREALFRMAQTWLILRPRARTLLNESSGSQSLILLTNLGADIVSRARRDACHHLAGSALERLPDHPRVPSVERDALQGFARGNPARMSAFNCRNTQERSNANSLMAAWSAAWPRRHSVADRDRLIEASQKSCRVPRSVTARRSASMAPGRLSLILARAKCRLRADRKTTSVILVE